MHSLATMQLALVLCLCAVGSSLALNERPIIGVVSEQVYKENSSYIAASYVKFLESAGARVVPILNNSTDEELKHIFSSVNGVLFPGGGVSLETSNYSNVGRTLFSLAMQANEAGDHFPIWWTCLGFQLLSVLQAGDGVISGVDAENYPIPLNLTNEARGSRMFSQFSTDAFDWVSSEAITMNNHHYAVSMATFSSTPKLNEFFTVLSTNLDRKGVQFVSSMEAKQYPFYAVQWHPEKNTFEWNTREALPHSEHAVIIEQMVANFFVQEARRSSHRYASLEEEYRSLIYNYGTTYTGLKHDFEQEYYF